MANIINLATETKQDEIIANVVNAKETVNAVNINVNNVNTNVNANKSTLATVNANTSTINTNLGTPTSTASIAISANAHAKLNALLSNTSNIMNNATGANMFNSTIVHKNLGYASSESNGNIMATLSGKMLLKNVKIVLYQNPEEYASSLYVDGKIFKPTASGGGPEEFIFSEIYVNSLLRIRAASGYNFGVIGITYEEMYLFS